MKVFAGFVQQKPDEGPWPPILPLINSMCVVFFVFFTVTSVQLYLQCEITCAAYNKGPWIGKGGVWWMGEGGKDHITTTLTCQRLSRLCLIVSSRAQEGSAQPTHTLNSEHSGRCICKSLAILRLPAPPSTNHRKIWGRQRRREQACGGKMGPLEREGERWWFNHRIS